MDRALIEKLAAHIVDSVEQLRRHGKPGRLHEDPVQFGFVVYTLQTAVQAAIDMAAVIVSERGLGEPSTHRDLFQKLASDGWIDDQQADLWRRIVGFRNIVVHRYLTVDAGIVRGIVEGHLEDLLALARSVRDRLQTLS